MPPGNFYRSKMYQRHDQNHFEQSPRKNRCENKNDHIKELGGMHTTCIRKAYQKATVSTPVTIRPFSFAGPTKTVCCSEPVIKDIKFKPRCNEDVCYFTISQEICVEIPIHFGAQACLGDSWIDCHEASTEECDDCDDHS